MEKGRGYACLSTIYLQKGDLPRAEQTARLATQNSPDQVRLLWLALLRRGQSLNAVPPEQDSKYSARGSRPETRLVHYRRGEAAFLSNQPEDALRHFQEALRHRPGWGDMEWHEDCLAYAYLRLGRLAEAIAEYERVLRLQPNDGLVNFRLGLAYRDKGEMESARKQFAHFLKLWQSADSDAPAVVDATRFLSGHG